MDAADFEAEEKLEGDIQIVNVLPKIAKSGTFPTSDAASRE